MPEEAHRAVHAARDHAQAVEFAREAQMTQAIKDALHQSREATIAVIQEALTYGGNDRPALVARIPVICNDIRWIKWGIMGILGGMGALLMAFIYKGFGL